MSLMNELIGDKVVEVEVEDGRLDELTLTSPDGKMYHYMHRIRSLPGVGCCVDFLMKSNPPIIRGLYRRGTDPAWKLTSPQDREHEYLFFGTEKEAKKAANWLFTDNGFRPRVRLLGSV